MTYKQTKEAVQAILENHAMIKRVIFNSPLEWMFANEQPEFPICCFTINNGSFEKGYKNFTLTIWFLDKSGKEGEFETDVVSDQVEIANDIVSLLRQSQKRSWLMDDNISFQVISDSFEDYLAGVQLDVTLKTIDNYDACSVPVLS